MQLTGEQQHSGGVELKNGGILNVEAMLAGSHPRLGLTQVTRYAS